MDMTGNTILITGGGSGIGRGLAEAFHKLGNTVIISGRSRERLEGTVAANPGIEAMTLDVADPADIQRFTDELVTKQPAVNVLINNAGIMGWESFDGGGGTQAAEDTITTNLRGPIRLSDALLPTLRKQEKAVVMNVTSGLAFVPLTTAPTYSATKAALHSYTESMRYQLRGSNIEVIELAPPYVQTHLTGESQASDPRAMPLDEFIAEAMQILESQPESGEVIVSHCEPLRFAAQRGAYTPTFEGLNEAMAGMTP
ncbi:MAG: SDR family oxidoreductase [Phycisphaerales bacterium]